jgi:hypothetical protein
VSVKKEAKQAKEKEMGCTSPMTGITVTSLGFSSFGDFDFDRFFSELTRKFCGPFRSSNGIILKMRLKPLNALVFIVSRGRKLELPDGEAEF